MQKTQQHQEIFIELVTLMCSRRGQQLLYAAGLLIYAADSHEQMHAQSQLRQLGYRLQEAGWLGIFRVSASVAQSAGVA